MDIPENRALRDGLRVVRPRSSIRSPLVVDSNDQAFRVGHVDHDPDAQLGRQGQQGVQLRVGRTALRPIGPAAFQLLNVDPTDSGPMSQLLLREMARRWITLDTSRVALALARQRLVGGKKLMAALKADIDVDAWESLTRTTSRPFPRPETGRIAVKVINDYGDEVMKVYSV